VDLAKASSLRQVQNHGGGDDRAGPRAAPRFVKAGDAQAAFAQQRALVLERRPMIR